MRKLHYESIFGISKLQYCMFLSLFNVRRVIETARVDVVATFSVHPTIHHDYDDEFNEQ